MPKNQYPLPEFSALVRWTVQDVINWLTKNNLTNCIKVFREYGIDGNKLINSTDRDLINIECPRRESKEILSFINQVHIPRGNRGGGGNYRQPQPGYRAPEPQPQEYSDEGSESDDSCCWSDNEFSDDNQGANSDSSYEEPVDTGIPPPRPTTGGRSKLPDPRNNSYPTPAPAPRRPPPPPTQDEEFYEDPDDHPQPPMGRPPPRGQVPLPPRPAIPVPSQEPEEFYEEPDRPKVQATHGGPLPPTPQSIPSPIPPRSRGKAPVPPPISSVPSRPSSDEMDQGPFDRPRPPPPESMPKHRHQPEPEDLYEDPDDQPPPTRSPAAPRRPLPRAPAPVAMEDDMDDDSDEDDYLNMDDGDQGMAPPRHKGPAVPPSNRGKPSKPRHREPEPPKQRHKKQEHKPRYREPEPPQEDYEEPDSHLVKKEMQKRSGKGVAVLPMMNDLNLSNKTPDPPRGRRDIPPPPQQPSSRSNTVESKSETSVQLSEADYEKQKWYHKTISRAAAESQLRHYNIDGMYLIRKSSQGGDKPYTLQIIYQNQIFNLPIRRNSNTGLFAMGKPKAGEKTFVNLVEIVNFFKRNYLVLSGGQQTTLVKSLPRT